MIATETKTQIKLRSYQIDAGKKFFAALDRGVKRSLINLPTGTGKTVLGAFIAKKADCRVLWIAHREELLTQPEKTFSMVWAEASRGIVKAERNEVDAQVVFASVQTISRGHRLEQLGSFDLIVIDEAHHATAPSYIKILEHFKAWDPEGPVILGLTATIERADSANIGKVFQEITYTKQLLEMIRAGYLADLRAVRIRIDGLNLDSVKQHHGDYAAGALADELLRAHVPYYSVEAWKKYAQGRTTLVFTPTVDVARQTAEAFDSAGIPAEYVSGQTPADERAEMLDRLSTGETLVIANCAVLTEGFDEPTVSAVIMARPTRSKTLYVQCVGRGTRRAPGKEDCIIIDMAGATDRHDLVQAPALMGLDPSDLEDGEKSVTEIWEEKDQKEKDRKSELLQKYGFQGEEIQPVRQRLQWLQLSDGSRAVTAGQNGSVVLQKSGSEYVAMLYPSKGSARALCEPVWQELAVGIAEDYVRRCNAVGLARSDASWRHGPASEKQLDILKRLDAIIYPGITKGAASDEIGRLFLEKKIKRRRI